VPPDGGKPVGYTRATTIAKTADDTTALTAWKSRMVAVGLSERPDLYATISDITDNKTELNRLCEKAAEAGGATIRRDLGTHIHAMVEKSFTDPDYTPPPAHTNDINAVHRTVKDHGYTVNADMCERICVDDRHRIAGTFDMMISDRDGQNYIADLKTGSSVKYSGLSFATQLTIYANADALYTQGVAADGSDDTREPMPPGNTDHAIIVHLQPGSGHCELHAVTLNPALIDMALQIRETRRNAAGFLTPLAINHERNRWIRSRIATIVETNREMIVGMWPADLPTPKQQPAPYNNPQIDRIVTICDLIETELQAPFGTKDPAAPRRRKQG